MAEFNIPGVYSEIDASAAVQSLSPNDNVIGIVADATSGDTNKAYAPISFDDAKEKYGEDSTIVKLMAVAIKNGGNKFILVRAEKTGAPGSENIDYASALEVLELEEAVNIVITDATNPTSHTEVKNHCYSASLNRNERISFVGFDVNTDQQTVMTSAQGLNSGRMYTFYPNPLDVNGNEVSGIYGAAAIAGQVASETDPSMPMTNVELKGFFGLSKKLKVSEMSALIDAGIIPLEVNNGSITIVRAISTYTKKGSQKDTTWQELTTTRISDYIFKDLRTRLRSKYARAKQGINTRNSIKSEVLSSLLNYQQLEYIKNVENTDVSIAINPSDPLRNDISFKYGVTGPLNVIHLKGHLQI